MNNEIDLAEYSARKSKSPEGDRAESPSKGR